MALALGHVYFRRLSQLGTVVLGGGSGFVGKAVARKLKKHGYKVVIISRKPGVSSMTWSDLQKDGLPPCVAVFSVAGQNVLDPTRRWTPGFKQNVWASRVNTTKALARIIDSMEHPPKVFVTMSGVGYYKPSETEEYTEDSAGGDFDFLSNLCTDWEAAGKLENSKTRHVIIRSGIVLGRRGGMIQQLFLPFYLGLGGPVGSGKQFMPWIHIEDLVGLFIHAIENENVKGILNGVAPHVVTNGEFSKAFGRALWRPVLIPLPAAVVNLLFGAERAKMMVEGQKVIPKRTLESGFRFKFTNITSACKEFSRLFYRGDSD